jgi:hypothetical protein
MAFQPAYVIPCHCTGRKAVMTMEQLMAGAVHFSTWPGTTLTFCGLVIMVQETAWVEQGKVSKWI